MVRSGGLVVGDDPLRLFAIVFWGIPFGPFAIVFRGGGRSVQGLLKRGARYDCMHRPKDGPDPQTVNDLMCDLMKKINKGLFVVVFFYGRPNWD